MRRFCQLFLLLIISFNCIGQSATIKGRIADTLDKKNLSNAVVSLIKQSDSTLFKFSRSNPNGEFVINNVTKGKYKILITFPKFADYGDDFEVVDNSTIDFGTVALTQKAKLLETVIVRSGSSIRLKGDTTEFTADSFAVKEGATVEDLLKNLPGFQVDNKGNITTQGKRVDKVLVDGEEFFGDDPTMATQNIGAKAVDKVQVYDTKTDQQNITGISSGNEGKTINIKLKEESKKGGFGRFYAGTDFDRYHDAKGLYNRFVGKKKLSVYGTKSTVSTGSLNYQDQQKLGMESDAEYDEISGYYYSFGSSDEFTDWNLRGLPDSYTAGALFSNKWSGDKQNFNTSYRYNRLATENVNSTLTQTILENGSIFNNRKVVSNALNMQHALNLKYEWKIDSFASIKYTGAGIYKTSQSFGKTITASSNEKDRLLNYSDQERDNETERKQLDNQLTYRQQFRKLNRLLLVTMRYGHVEDDNSGMLKTATDYYNRSSGLRDSTSLIDQMKKMDGISRTFGAKATFSEPLSLKWNLVLDYAYNNNNSNSNKNSFNKSVDGKYEDLAPLYSNNFDMVAASHTGNTIFRFIDKKLRMAMGSGISSVQLRLHNLDNNSRNTYNFLNVTPQLQMGYTIKPQNTVSFNYRGTTRQPRVDQLQPILDNNDPLNFYRGNSNLKVAFNHNFSTGYNNYKVLKARYIYFNLGYNFTQNSIVNYNIVDTSTGARIYTPLNANGANNWYFSSVWQQGEGNKKWRKWIQLSANGGRNVNFTNSKSLDIKDAQKVLNDYTGFNLYAGVGYSVTDKYNFNIRPQVGHTTSRSSLKNANNLSYFTYGGSVDGYVTLGRFELSTDVTVDYREKLPIFSQNTNIIRWNGYVSRKVFKDKSGKVFIVANDILNQNKGYSRVINSNIITDDQYLNISRYFLLKFEWTFNKTPGK